MRETVLIVQTRGGPDASLDAIHQYNVLQYTVHRVQYQYYPLVGLALCTELSALSSELLCKGGSTV